MDITCRKTNCKHNDKLTCVAHGITISDGLSCLQFEKGDKGKDFSRNIFDEDTPNVAPYRHTKKLALKCNAKCLFNREHCCIANGITVNPIKEVPKCTTFLKP